jgi:xanthine/CO dehydrogenase XdhC/CoxF family maturation factor
MNDQREIIRTLSQLDVPVLMATVLHTEGPSYRATGTRALLSSHAQVGMLSGGCVEQALHEAATDLQAGEATLFWYDGSDPDDLIFGLRSGCGGKVLVLLEKTIPQQIQPFFKTLWELIQERDFAEVYTVVWTEGETVSRIDRMLFSDGFMVDSINADPFTADAVVSCKQALKKGIRQRSFQRDNCWVLRDVPEPAPRLLVCGYNPGSAALLLPAQHLGWEIHYCDHRTLTVQQTPHVRLVERDAYLAGFDLDDRTAVLAMTHQLDLDMSAFKQLIDKPFFYFGVLGSRKRAEQFEKMLNPFTRKFWVDQHSRIFMPAGLDIHAETPEEIALSICAEIQAVLRNRTGGPLSQSPRPIHNH